MMIEFFAAALTLWCVWLTTKRNILSWWVGIAGLILYTFVFFDAKLYADFGLQFIFLSQSLYGLWNWNMHKDETERVQIVKMSNINRVSSVSAIIFLYIIITHILIHHTDASVPYVDAYLTSTCIVANFLLGKRAIENWVLWIQADVIYIFLFSYKGLYISAVLYLILGVLAVKGLIEWNNKLKQSGIKY